MARRADERPRNILLTRFSALGDVAMTVPVIYDTCRANPRRRFVMLTKPRAAALFTSAPANLEVVAPDLTQYSGLAGLRRLFSELRSRYGLTTVVDLHDVLRTKVLRTLARLAGMRVATIRKGRRRKRALTRRRGKVLVPLRSTFGRYRRAFADAGIDTGEPAFSSLYDAPGAAPARLFAAATPPRRPGERWIAVAPFAAHRGKAYPVELMERVVSHFASLPAFKVFILGFGESEEGVAADWAALYPGVVNTPAARMDMAAEMALLNHCECIVTMDSANMHLASLAGIRAVSVWGATHPYSGFMGWRQSAGDAVQLDLPCRPCSVFGNKPCRRGDYFCLAGIKPEAIISKVETVLDNKPK